MVAKVSWCNLGEFTTTVTEMNITWIQGRNGSQYGTE